MGKRALRREPRAHWALLVLAMLVLFAGLCFNGYVTGAGAEGTHVPVEGAPGPAAATEGAAVQRLEPDGTVTSRALPARTIALTFDDGPDPAWTPAVLEVLARYRVHATFFQVGAQINRYPEITRRVVDAGHEVGLHTFTHVAAGTVPAWRLEAEVKLTANALAAAGGPQATLLRLPYSATPRAESAAEYDAWRRGAPGYLQVLADHDTEDWRRPGVPAIVRAIRPGVVMLHDSGGDRAQTIAALDQAIPRLQAKGYRFVTVSEALGLPRPPAAAAAQKWRGLAVRVAQNTAGWLAGALTVVMTVAAGIGLLRLLIQLVTARVHWRRARARHERPLAYLGLVSVVVPAYNEAANIEATVRSLIGNDYPDIEVVVVDDGSSDDTAGIVERLGLPRVRVIRQPNAGKPAALNTGIRHSHGQILVLVDGDTVFAPDAVGRLIQPFTDPEIGAVSGNTKVANRTGLLGRWQHLEYVIGFNLDRRMFEIARCMPTVPGAIGAFRRAAIQDAGGVSGETLAEDTDFTMAVLRAGWHVVYEPAAIAWTEAPATVRQLWRQRYRWCYGTMQAMWKHRDTVLRRGPAGRLGRRGIGYLLLFQVLLPITAPMIDVYGVYGLLFLSPLKVAAVWSGFTAAQVATAAIALRMDRERYGPLWTLPLQQIVYRQLMYLVVIQSTVMALVGGRLRWHRMVRIGAAQQYAAGPPTAAVPMESPGR
ncbi:bifunctional polysaccharide deacetylase/glycosyltransferase family 2 protein [Actinoplanes oblitus]|uniref:Bifunctional polysaccharide deacetylase/glycosyltransferase family 2 protein n=1 Tax=Actinoplanes oblitus TaxID=3040509 RepID=A0ABY8WS16_9ACTN|nr:bifunctional polysaccharide deacetylase/glycosyltransferase family 2 protein [Actinoplanes oblitus]WIM99650.1 bifunctional polysaccharide deacetylase/glycosyltransferase family 2 protein [Actinoplanes oblitus]